MQRVYSYFAPYCTVLSSQSVANFYFNLLSQILFHTTTINRMNFELIFDPSLKLNTPQSQIIYHPSVHCYKTIFPMLTYSFQKFIIGVQERNSWNLSSDFYPVDCRPCGVFVRANVVLFWTRCVRHWKCVSHLTDSLFRRACRFLWNEQKHRAPLKRIYDWSNESIQRTICWSFQVNSARVKTGAWLVLIVTFVDSWRLHEKRLVASVELLE